MNVLIVEDEKMAMENLARALQANFPEIKIVGSTGSIKDTVSWLKSYPDAADVIFMDVELSDGNCFEIFRQVDVKAKVIMTTAYDSYAVKAFEVNSIDYLLKPVETEALKRAVGRCTASGGNADLEKLSMILRNKPEYKQRFIVRLNDKIMPVRAEDIAYFYSEEKNTVLVTFDGMKYIMDATLDILSGELDPEQFFRISRSCILNIQAIESIVKHFGSRMKIMATPRPDFDMTVSRSRVDDFMQWLEGNR